MRFFPFFLLLLASNYTQAADLPIKNPIMLSAPAETWSGFYAGINLGLTNNADLKNETTWKTINSQKPKNEGFSAISGAHAGYDYQYNRFVVGVNAELALSGLTRQGIASNNTGYVIEVPQSGALRLKAGFLFSKEVMLYAIAGLTGANVKAKALSHVSAFKTGYAAGAGFEYRYSDFKEHNFSYLNGDKIQVGYGDVRALVAYRI